MNLVFKMIAHSGRAHFGNEIGKYVRIQPGQDFQLADCRLGQGSQILRVPPGSRIANLRLGPGASHRSRWAPLRGGVLKLAPDRTQPLFLNGRQVIELDGKSLEVILTVPTGYVLMDRESFGETQKKNLLEGRIRQGEFIPYRVVDHFQVCRERLFLVHASYCHPHEILLPQDTFLEVSFQPHDYVKEDIYVHYAGTLFVDEEECDAAGDKLIEVWRAARERASKSRRNPEEIPLPVLNIAQYFASGKSFSSIMIKLKEGGSLLLRDRAAKGKKDMDVPNPWRSAASDACLIPENSTNIDPMQIVLSWMTSSPTPFGKQRYRVDLPGDDLDGSGWGIDFEPVENALKACDESI